MIAPSNGKGHPDDAADTSASPSPQASATGAPTGQLLKPADGKADPAKDGQSIDDLHGAIQELIGLFDMASDLARRGEQVNVDLLAMRVAVLCDAICNADPAVGRSYRADLEALLGHLNMLESTLLRERVQLALSVEAADRRLRAKAAYGRVLPSMTASRDASGHKDDPSDE